MRRTVTRFLLILALTPVAMAQADTVQFVVPNRPGVPIVINGQDASFAVVEGDWGLARGVRVQPTVYGGRPIEEPEVGRYFPSSGQMPGYGRLEIETPRKKKQRQAESYSRFWGAQSAPPPLIAPAEPSPPISVYPQIAPDFSTQTPQRR